MPFNNIEYQKQYRKTHKKQTKEYQKKYNQDHKNECIDCGTKIQKYSTRCNSCELKRKWREGIYKSPARKDGRTLKKYYCIEPSCGKEIGINSGIYGGGRCRSCAAKEKLKDPQNNPMFGVHRFGKDNPNYGNGDKTRGKLNYNYIDGRSYEKYPKEFTQSLREQIRKRNNYECQGEECSMTQGEHFIVYGRDLHVHHIDYNKNNCQEGNLITLCQQCNLRANLNRDYWYTYYTYIMEEKYGLNYCETSQPYSR